MTTNTSIYEKLVEKKYSLSSNELTLEMVFDYNNSNSVAFVFAYDVYDIIDNTNNLRSGVLPDIYHNLPQLIKKYFGKGTTIEFHVYNLIDLNKDETYFNEIKNSVNKLQSLVRNSYDSSVVFEVMDAKFKQPEEGDWWPECFIKLNVLTNNDVDNKQFINHYYTDIMDTLYDNKQSMDISIENWCEMRFELDIVKNND